MLSSRIYRCVLIYYYVCHAHVYSVKNLLKCLFTLLFASQWQLIASVTRSRGGADGFFFVSVFSNPSLNYNFSLQQISLKLILTKSHQTNHINLRSLWFEVWNVMHAKPVNIFYLPFWKKSKRNRNWFGKIQAQTRWLCVCTFAFVQYAWVRIQFYLFQKSDETVKHLIAKISTVTPPTTTLPKNRIFFPFE